MQELLKKAQSGCNESFEKILDTQTRSIHYFKNRYFGEQYYDVVQLCYVAIWKALHSYDFVHDFSKHAFNRMQGELNNSIVKHKGRKKRDANEVSLYQQINHDDRTLMDHIAIPNDIEEQIAFKEYIELLKKRLSIIECNVLELLLEGYNNTEIRENLILGYKISKVAVGKIIERIGVKYRKMIKEEEFNLKVALL